MHISIDSDNVLEKFHLVDLYDNVINFRLDEDIDLKSNWYQLIIEYTGKKTKITDIKINGLSINHYIYTGFFTERDTGTIHQPGCALWVNGHFSIWLHTDIGVMTQNIEESIRNGDHGQNLFEKYLHTVDKSVIIDERFQDDVKAYFKVANGPRWWRKNTLRQPYEICSKNMLENIDKLKLLNELDLDLKLSLEKKVGGKDVKDNTVIRKFIKETTAYPFVEIDDLKSQLLIKLCKNLGFKRLLNVAVNFLPPGNGYAPHIDDHYSRDSFKYLRGPSVFVWSMIDDEEANGFKLSSAGMLPIKDGVFFNQSYFSHATFNNSTTVRPMLQITGDRGTDFEF